MWPDVAYLSIDLQSVALWSLAVCCLAIGLLYFGRGASHA